jgi:predicted dehydrogenase
MATTVDDAKLMLTTALKQNLALNVGFNLRHETYYAQTAQVVKSGSLGHTHLIEFDLQSQNPLVAWSKSPWFFSAEAGGGVLIDKGPHVFDMLNYVFDDYPTSVSTVSSTFFESNVEDSAVCMLEYPGKRIGVGIMSWMASRVIDLLSVHGTAQSLFVTPEIFLEANGSDLIQIPMFRKAAKMLVNMKFNNLPLFKKATVNTFQMEIDLFVNQILNKKYDYSTALSGANVVITCEAAKESIQTGKKINCLPINKSIIN